MVVLGIVKCTNPSVSSGSGSSLGQAHPVVFSGKTINFTLTVPLSTQLY